MTDELQHVRVERRGAVALITLTRGAKLNAISTAMSEHLIEHLEVIGTDEGVRAIVLAAEGRCFCAGADVTEYAGHSHDQFVAYQRRGRELNDLIAGMPKPVVAAVQGPALGGGFELALACDAIIMATEAYLAMPEVDLGLVPGGGATVRLTSLLGRTLTKDLTMTGRRMYAGEAAERGVATLVVSAGEVLSAAMEYAGRLAGKPPLALQSLKRLINEGQDRPMSIALSAEQEALAGLFVSPDGREGIDAFMHKRPARFGSDQH